MASAIVVLVFKVCEMNVLYCFDTKFWRMAAVSIGSLVASQKNSSVTVYCMVAPRTRGRRTIERIVRAAGGRLVWRVVRISENKFMKYGWSRWSPVIFYRIFACDIFPELDRMLYLDSDTLVCDDLTNMYNTDMGAAAMGAVRDMAPVHQEKNPNGKYVREFKENYLKHNLYINSGVLLLNMIEMRKNQSALLSVDVPLKYPDQDILNVALDGKIYELPLRYNCIPDMDIDEKFSDSDIEQAKKKIAVAHFYAVKPYIYKLAPRNSYAMFAAAARAVGMYPEQFLNMDIKHMRRKFTNRTSIPFLRATRGGKVRLFGILIK